MKLSKPVKDHLYDAEESAGQTCLDLQFAWNCLSDRAQNGELGKRIQDLRDRAQRLYDDIFDLPLPY